MSGAASGRHVLVLADSLSFTEFVEALSKLSLVTMQGEAKLSDVKKILVGLNFLCEFFVTGSFDGLSGRGEGPVAIKDAAVRRPSVKPAATTGDADNNFRGGSAAVSKAKTIESFGGSRSRK